MYERVGELDEAGAHAILISMGFQADDAETALNLYGNVQAAVDSLLDSSCVTDIVYEDRRYEDDYSLEEATLSEFHVNWYVAMAQSVQQSYTFGHRFNLACKEEEDLLEWANEMLRESSVQNAVDVPLDSRDRSRIVQLCQSYNQLAKDLEELNEERQVKAHSINLGVRKVKQRKRQETSYGDDLEGLLKHSEEVREETRQLREFVLSFTQHPFGMHETTYEEIYLFMKEFVHNDENLENEQVKRRIHQYVFSRIDSLHANHFLPCLLELLLSENHEVVIMRRINSECDEQVDQTPSRDPEIEAELTASISHLQGVHTEELENLQKALEHEAHRQQNLLRERLKQRREKESLETLSAASCLSKTDTAKSILARDRSITTGMKRKHVMVMGELSRIESGACTAEPIDSIKDSIDDQVVHNLKEQYNRDVLNLRRCIGEESERQKLSIKEKRNKRSKIMIHADMAQRIEATAGDLVGSSTSMTAEESNPVARYNAHVDNLQRLLLKMVDSAQLLEETLVRVKEELMKSRCKAFPSIPSSSAETDLDKLSSRVKEDFAATEKNAIKTFVDEVFGGAFTAEHLEDSLEQMLVKREVEMKREVQARQLGISQKSGDDAEKWMQVLVEKERQIRESVYAHIRLAKVNEMNEMDCNGFSENKTNVDFNGERSARYSQVTMDLMAQLKSRRQQQLREIQQKWAAGGSFCEKGEDKAPERATDEEAKAHELADCEKLLTMNEFRLLEMHKDELRRKGVGVENFNVQELVDEIHEGFSAERRELVQQVKNERQRQEKSTEMRRGARAGGKGTNAECTEDSYGIEAKKLSRQHKDEREAMELVLDLEQTRQRQALQSRLASRRKSKALPPVIRKQGKGLH